MKVIREAHDLGKSLRPNGCHQEKGNGVVGRGGGALWKNQAISFINYYDKLMVWYGGLTFLEQMGGLLVLFVVVSAIFDYLMVRKKI
jgi:hypothetical protein